jgi:hypothetical protein
VLEQKLAQAPSEEARTQLRVEAKQKAEARQKAMQDGEVGSVGEVIWRARARAKAKATWIARARAGAGVRAGARAERGMVAIVTRARMVIARLKRNDLDGNCRGTRLLGDTARG